MGLVLWTSGCHGDHLLCVVPLASVQLTHLGLAVGEIGWTRAGGLYQVRRARNCILIQSRVKLRQFLSPSWVGRQLVVLRRLVGVKPDPGNYGPYRRLQLVQGRIGSAAGREVAGPSACAKISRHCAGVQFPCKWCADEVACGSGIWQRLDRG